MLQGLEHHTACGHGATLHGDGASAVLTLRGTQHGADFLGKLLGRHLRRIAIGACIQALRLQHDAYARLFAQNALQIRAITRRALGAVHRRYQRVE